VKHLTPLKTIRAKCLDCSCNQPKEVRLCPCFDCPLWGYRMGVRPMHKRAQEANEEARVEKLRGSPLINCSNAVETSAGSKQEELTLQKRQKVSEDTEGY
jgi:hypothetical protein